VAGFSATDAAFTGFRVVWRRPLAAAMWAALQVTVTLGTTLFITLSAGAAFTKAADAGFQLNPDPAPMMAQLETLAPTYAVIAIGALVLQAVWSAAMNRAVLRPEQSAFGYLRLAGDELRQLGLFVLIGLLAAALYLGVVTVGGIVFGLLGFANTMEGLALALLILAPVILVVFIFAGVRLSLASPITFATGRIDLFASWAMTRGRFWSLFWTYALAFVVNVLVSALIFAIALFAVAILGGGFGALGQGAEADFTSLATAFTPARALYMGLTAVGAALTLPITMTPPVTIYRALTGETAGKVFD
jgi:hypothetical protein